ncbi:Activator of Hsp90 ATPase -like protein [uncultured archaeon]|nr:Activator of Hsp90 ATPase -like protein [uncultured archaeon]
MRKMKTIRQSVLFKANPHEIYEMLMDSQKHSGFTGEKASISREVNGEFSAYDGYITGLNLELVPDRKIVQSWRGKDWSPGHYSKVTISFEEVKDGTRLTFIQTGVPDEHYDEISQGWHDYYWIPMKKMLET